jgi:hypothetical protein
MSLSFDRNAIADCTKASTTSQCDAEAEQAATYIVSLTLTGTSSLTSEHRLLEAIRVK